jgi:hypothetical protein
LIVELRQSCDSGVAGVECGKVMALRHYDSVLERQKIEVGK